MPPIVQKQASIKRRDITKTPNRIGLFSLAASILVLVFFLAGALSLVAQSSSFYTPTAGTGLMLNLSSGTFNCNNTIQQYAGGTITLAASAANYIYLDTTNATCSPSVNQSGFTPAMIPIAIAATGVGGITTLTDVRSAFSTAVTSSTPISILSYGAKCDATSSGGVWIGTDDTAAIQAAIEAASQVPAKNGVVTFPTGERCLVNSVSMGSPISLAMDDGTVAGAGCSTGTLNTSGATVTLTSTTSGLMNFPASAPVGGNVIIIGGSWVGTKLVGGTPYDVSNWSTTSLTLTGSAGTQTNVPFQLLGGVGGIQGGGTCVTTGGGEMLARGQINNEGHNVPSSSSYTATPLQSGFSTDLGVIYQSSGAAFTKVTTPTAAGQYSVDGSGTYTFSSADAGASIYLSYQFSTPDTLNYALNLHDGVSIDGQNATIVSKFIVPTTNATVSTASRPLSTSLVIFKVATDTVHQTYIHNLKFENVFSPFISTGLYVVDYENIDVNSCGFGAITQRQDRARFHRYTMINCAAGIISGGWWSSRNNEIIEAGGYNDKSKYEDISFIQGQGSSSTGWWYSSWAQAFDSFFDTFFWHTQDTYSGRLTDPLSPLYDIRTNQYLGVYGVGLSHYARGIRPSVSNAISTFFHFGSPRYAYIGQDNQGIEMINISGENNGWGDGWGGGCVFGPTDLCTSPVGKLNRVFSNGIVDPYAPVAGVPPQGLVYIYNGTGSVDHMINENSPPYSTDIGGIAQIAMTDISVSSLTPNTRNVVGSMGKNIILPLTQGKPGIPSESGIYGDRSASLDGQWGVSFYDDAGDSDASSGICLTAEGIDFLCARGKSASNPNVSFNTSYRHSTNLSYGSTNYTNTGDFNPTCVGNQGQNFNVNTSGTTVTIASPGKSFYTNIFGFKMIINGNTFTVATIDSATSLTLTASAGTLTSVPATMYGVCLYDFGRGGAALGFGLAYVDDVANSDNLTHMSLTSAVNNNANNRVETFSWFRTGKWSLGKSGASPAATYTGEIGGPVLFDVAPTVTGFPATCQQYPCLVGKAAPTTYSGTTGVPQSNLITAPTAGYYRTCMFIDITAVATAGTFNLSTVYTTDGHAAQIGPGNTNATTLNAANATCYPIYVDSGVAINYQIVATGVTGTPTIRYAVTLEKLQ